MEKINKPYTIEIEQRHQPIRLYVFIVDSKIDSNSEEITTTLFTNIIAYNKKTKFVFMYTNSLTIEKVDNLVKSNIISKEIKNIKDSRIKIDVKYDNIDIINLIHYNITSPQFLNGCTIREMFVLDLSYTQSYEEINNKIIETIPIISEFIKIESKNKDKEKEETDKKSEETLDQFKKLLGLNL
jgi:hypothetical protein